MHMKTVFMLLLIKCSEFCLTIKVPIKWEGDSSEVKDASNLENEKERFKEYLDVPNGVKEKKYPLDYFQYPAKKPQFAVDVAIFHGVQSPENHYRSYPIKPYTEAKKPNLGKHHMLDEDKHIYQPYQKFVKPREINKNHLSPVATNYEIFHPYRSEEPALQRLYKDPILTKVRNDLNNAKNRLQTYEKEAAKSDVTQNEYLENPDEIDKKKPPHRNVPSEFEVYKPLKTPAYYKPVPKFNNRDHILNNKFKHPWNQNYVKVRPLHYQPLKNQLQKLRQHHSIKYADELNEYPQVQQPEQNTSPPDGYDIYENAKAKFTQLRNNVDESLDKIVRQNRPNVYQKLELQGVQNDKVQKTTDESGDEEEEEEDSDDDDDDDDFVPVKNYAQVRKTETTKHLPRHAALEDAETYDEIINAPRLREAIKSTKAQTVYTEEGYEDAAYDHAGEHKHASDHERHGGFLKQQEISGGKYKIPSVNGNYKDGRASGHGDQVYHKENWEDNKKNNEITNESEDYTEKDEEDSVEDDIYQDTQESFEVKRNKRENDVQNKSNMHDNVDNWKLSFKVPKVNITSTFLSEDDILQISKQKLVPQINNIQEKYPYYFKNVDFLNKDSPLRYAENLRFIPKKSKGGTEFYDSRSKLQCAEVEENVDPIPEKLKTEENPDDASEEQSGKANKSLGKPRLKGLGDKIDCFKAKYFGENPLDSPFFNEEIILNPEPVTPPNQAVFKLNNLIYSTQDAKNDSEQISSPKLKNDLKIDIFDVLNKLKSNHNLLRDSLDKTNDELRSYTLTPINISLLNNSDSTQQLSLYKDVMQNIYQKPLLLSYKNKNYSKDFSIKHTPEAMQNSNVTYNFHDTQDVTKSPSRRKRATPFVYEPYKIIRDGQFQDSKKISTKSNVSPLIKQLQSSKIIEAVTKLQQDADQPTKRNYDTLTYKEIRRNNKQKSKDTDKGEASLSSFVDVNVDKRRGEPRYELKHSNHKVQYTPVENKKSMSLEDYEAQTSGKIDFKEENETKLQEQTKKTEHILRPYFDVSEFLPKSVETQQLSPSETISRVIRSTTLTPKRENHNPSIPIKIVKTKSTNENNENFDEYDEEVEDEEIALTTSTPKPSFRMRSKANVNTEKPIPVIKNETTSQKLQLVTRFRPPLNEEHTEVPLIKQDKSEEEEIMSAKYREKNKKSSKTTLVTDSKIYGKGEDDMKNDEVDSLIGIKHNMKEYMPSYEKEDILKHSESSESNDENEDYDVNGDEDDDDEDDEEEYNDEVEQPNSPSTTLLPSKRTLPKTTEAPISTTETRIAKIKEKPVVVKKKVHTHTELASNNSSPHTTQFQRDFKEIEIVKEIPPKILSKMPKKNLEALELYKDEHLAKDVNKLRDVEVFKEDLDIVNGPRHGGNYRSADLTDIHEEPANHKSRHGGNLKATSDDVEASQSENKKQVELNHNITPRRMHGGNIKSISEFQRTRNNVERSAKIIELDDADRNKPLNRGNLRLNHNRGRRRGTSRSAKYTELEDDNSDDNDDHSTNTRMHGGNLKPFGSSRSNRPMHGGNYRSAKLVQLDNQKQETQKTPSGSMTSEVKPKDVRSSAAALLNGFAQAVPLLTTTPAYILDPSKRMYYYVEA